MADRIAWSRADTQAYSAARTCTRLDDRPGDSINLDQVECTGYRAMIEAEPALLSIPWKTGFSVNRGCCHAYGQIMLQHSRFTGVDAREIITHDTGRSQGINHGCSCTGFTGCFWSRLDGSGGADFDAVTAPGTGREELALCNGTGRSLQEPE
jgi:hypothetical protein